MRVKRPSFRLAYLTISATHTILARDERTDKKININKRTNRKADQLTDKGINEQIDTLSVILIVEQMNKQTRSTQTDEKTDNKTYKRAKNR